MLYPVAIEVGDEHSAFGAVVPDIPGCYSAGDTFQEALDNIREAIELQLDALYDQQQDIPQAQLIDSYVNCGDYAGSIWCAVEVDIDPYLGKSQKVNVTLPELLIKRIDRMVANNPAYKTRSGFLAAAALHEMR